MKRSHRPPHDLPAPNRELLCRRAFLGRGVRSLSALALPALLGRLALAEELAPRASLPHASAKRVLLVFLNGGVSQLDVFDEKPLLNERRGQEIPASVHRNQGITAVTERRGSFPAVGSRFRFRRHGRSGRLLSELVPHLGAMADEFTLLRTLHNEHVLHENAITTLLTGTALRDRPSWGSWVTYALGRENENLPAFVVLLSNGRGDSPLQPRLWGSGFLPGKEQGVHFRAGASPVLDLAPPQGVSEAANQGALEAIERLNQLEAERSGDPAIATRIASYEMAARMQTSVPELADLKAEPEALLERYGAGGAGADFANNCVLARRLLERGVRFVQLCDGGWDHHGGIPDALPRKCQQIDRPLGALLADLKERGLLDDTLVVITSEFGRTPYSQGPIGADRYGRDHHNLAYCALLAGGGAKRGAVVGETDEWGWSPVDTAVHVNDLQATVLHCLGLDHERLTFRSQGRDFRLTDVRGRVVRELLA